MSTKSVKGTNAARTLANQRATLLIALVVGSAVGLNWTAMADRMPAVPPAAAIEQAVAAAAAEQPVVAPTTVAPGTVAVPSDASAPPAASAPAVQQLGSGAAPGGAAPTVAPTLAPAAVPPSAAPTPVTLATTAPTTPPTAPPTPPPTTPATVPPTTAVTTPATAPPTTVPPRLLTYDFAGVASQVVIAQYADQHIQFVSVTRLSGWVSQLEANGPNSVVVKFFNTVTHAEAQFAVERNGSQLTVSREY